MPAAPPLNPETDLGEVELRVDYIEDITSPHLDKDGIPVKCYNSFVDVWRASKEMAGPYRAEPDLKGMTKIIKRRRGSERQFPPGYSGSGNVVVQLYGGFRYWRFNQGTGSLEELSGRVVCMPDEAVQLVATTSAVYA
jgi:hypothetical protein